MSTETGISILKKVDDTTECAERILNLYFPAQIHEEMIEEREGKLPSLDVFFTVSTSLSDRLKNVSHEIMHGLKKSKKFIEKSKNS